MQQPTPTTVDLAALGRTVEQRLQVRRTGARTWQVSSHSEPSRWYSLYLHGDGDIDCDCPAGQHDRWCKHAAIVRVVALTGAAPEPEPQQATAAQAPLEDLPF